MPEPEAIFVADGDVLMPTPLAASAWGPDVLHGGPVAALVARAAERALPQNSAAERALPDHRTAERALPDHSTEDCTLQTDSAAGRTLTTDRAEGRSLPDHSAAERALSTDSTEVRPPPADSTAENRTRPTNPTTEGSLQASRLTVDLFRAVPRAPLTTEVELIREGRRLVVARVSVLADGLEVTRGQVLFLRRTTGPATRPLAPPPGPDGLETERGLSRGAPLPTTMGGGFHTLVDTRWPRQDQHGADIAPGTLVWVHVPFPIVAGETPTPFQRLAAVSDFGNALANYAADWCDPNEQRSASFINTDISVHLLRPPEGEWLALHADRSTHTAGVGLVEVTHFDHLGHYARATQARLANPR